MTNDQRKLPELLKQHDALTIEYQKATEFTRATIERCQQELKDILESEELAEMGDLEKEIKALVLTEGVTASSSFFMFIFKKGSTRWDGKKLLEFSTTHPGILKFQKTGKPSVSVKKVSK